MSSMAADTLCWSGGWSWPVRAGLSPSSGGGQPNNSGRIVTVHRLPATSGVAMLRGIAVIVLDQVAAFELGVLCEVFGTDRGADGFPVYEFDTCSPDGAPVRSTSGWLLTPSADLAPVDRADLVAIPAHPVGTVAPAEVLDALRRAADRGAYLL